ncbi:MAG: hypothetical protein P4L53_17515 [Candidatus Obscuribacterales bacterium]|nr:hypothetical protein [Candidatus Obscuribacterales bacterium]
MITRREVIESLGSDLYHSASLEARKIAPTCGMQSQIAEIGIADQVERKITELLENSRVSNRIQVEEVSLVLEIYEDLPCYHFLSHYQSVFLEERADEEKTFFWIKLRKFLDSEDEALAGPAVYFLWVDLFENPKTVQESWRQMLVELHSDRAIYRLLKCAGPVPCELKLPFYELLSADKKWHASICDSLYFSEFDYFGQMDSLLDRKRAREILDRLDVSTLDKEKFTVLLKSLEHDVRAPARNKQA